MTAEDPRARLDTAGKIATELAGIVAREGRDGLVWQQRLRGIAADLAATGMPELEVLHAARERFDSMYAGGRNFSDFHIWRDDPAERVAANEKVSALVGQLRRLLQDS